MTSAGKAAGLAARRRPAASSADRAPVTSWPMRSRTTVTSSRLISSSSITRTPAGPDQVEARLEGEAEASLAPTPARTSCPPGKVAALPPGRRRPPRSQDLQMADQLPAEGVVLLHHRMGPV